MDRSPLSAPRIRRRPKIHAFALLLGGVVAIAVAIPAAPLWPATIQDPDRPAILGPDARLLGNRDAVSLTRWADAPGDDEPIYLVSVSGVERGFARDGDQCMDGKLGGNIVPCEGEIARAARVLTPDHIADTGKMVAANSALPDWAGTPLPTIIDGDTITVIVPPAPLPEPPAPVPAPAAVALLMSAIVGAASIVTRNHGAAS